MLKEENTSCMGGERPNEFPLPDPEAITPRSLKADFIFLSAGERQQFKEKSPTLTLPCYVLRC